MHLAGGEVTNPSLDYNFGLGFGGPDCSLDAGFHALVWKPTVESGFALWRVTRSSTLTMQVQVTWHSLPLFLVEGFGMVGGFPLKSRGHDLEWWALFDIACFL